MDRKPSTMSVKEHIYRKLSQDLQIPLSTIKAVIDNQFRTALSALKDNNSLEIAGFGKILINVVRLRIEIKEIEYLIPYYKDLLKKPNTSSVDILEAQDRLEQIPGRLVDLKLRLEKYERSHK